ncbi:MAG: GHKL domain-containing protein [Clostridiaceae bacterium]|nr:GHKL domain-containing protein [Clostridiaceae bacterium]
MIWWINNPVMMTAGFFSRFVTAFLILRIMEQFLPVRKKRWAKPVSYLGCLFFTSMAIFVGDPINLPGAFLGFGCVVFLCCEGNWLQRLSMTLILSSIGFSLNALLDSAFVLYRIDLLKCLVWLTIYLTLSRFAPKQEYDLPTRLWTLVDVLTLTPLAATFITVLLGNIEGGSREPRVYLLLPVVTLTSIGLLWAVVVLARQQKLEQEKGFYEMNRIYYRNLEQEQFQVRRLRHDMANHLQTMSALPEPQLRDYLNELIHSPVMNHTQKSCENRIANIVLASKTAIMEQHQIRSEVEVSVPQKISIQDSDLCAVFANSLDNAIEACDKLPEDQRHISIKARTDKGLFVLKVQNSSCEKIVLENGTPVTTKQDKHSHGFGLAGIREIAARYGGSVEITEEEGMFTLLVYFPF